MSVEVARTADEQQMRKKRKSVLQRWFYALVGLLTMIPILLLTAKQIQNLERENAYQLAIYLLLLVHSAFVLLSMLSTALFCRITDALLTIVTIILLFAYTGLHFYIRFLFDQAHSSSDFIYITLRLSFVLIMFIFFLPWTGLLTHTYRKTTEKETSYPRATLFFWFVKLNVMLMLSLLILKIRNQQQWMIISLGLLLVSLWFMMARDLTNKKPAHWLTWAVFYLLSILQILHLVYIGCWSFHDYAVLSAMVDVDRFSLLIMTFVCGGANLVTHLLTLVFSLSFVCPS